MTASTVQSCDRIWINANLATMDDAVPAAYGQLRNCAIGVRDGKIAVIEPMAKVSVERLADKVIDACGAWITPGITDCHTHLVYGGNRAGEIALRLGGASYADIARQGGGILSTVRATRAMDEEQLLLAAISRLRALIAEGVTTVEIKSGYGLTLVDELKMLRVARRLADEMPVRVSTTLLAAHALPPEYAGRREEYIDLVCREIIPAAATEKLADAVDVFCERIAFSPDECARVFSAAGEYGLPVKAHAEQLSNLGGALLAARYGALSADHLEYLDKAGVEAMAAAGTVAVLLPGAFYSLRETQRPPIELLRAAGVPMAVAGDHNPGTSPFIAPRLMLNMACTLFGLTPEESFAGATRNAAKALGMEAEIGTLAVGKAADFLVWDIANPAELICELGVPRLRQRVFKGNIAAV
jgi:imidazolonepropionase